MSESYSGKKGFKSFLSKLIGHETKTEYVIPKEDMNERNTSSVMCGSHTSISSAISKLADIAINSRIKYVKHADIGVDMDITEYLETLGRAELLPYGESVLCLINSIKNFNFYFVYNDSTIYCIIRMDETDEILAIMQCTNNTTEYGLLLDLLTLSNICSNQCLESHIYRHICGLILNYVKISVSKFALPEEGMAYIIREFPNKSELVNYNEWINQFNPDHEDEMQEE